MFYKVKKDGKIIDALDNLQCVRYFNRISGILRCKEKDIPQGIISRTGEFVWHVDGWEEFPEEAGFEGDTVLLEEFDDQDLYEEILESLTAGEDYSDFDENEEPAEEDVPHIPTPMERLEALENALSVMAMERRTL